MTLISRSYTFTKVSAHVGRYCEVLGKLNCSVNISHAYSPATNSRSIKLNSHIKSFHICCAAYAKLYVEVENSHAHKWMEQNSSYSSTLCKPLEFKVETTHEDLESKLLQDWSCRSATEIFVTFRDLSFICRDSSLETKDPRLQNLFDAIVIKCVEFDTSQILTTLQCLSLWPQTDSIKDEPFYTLWTALDKACIKNLKEWDTNMCLLVADHWNLLNIARYSEYVKQCLKKIARKLHRLTPQQFVQLMFCINLCRKLPPSASKFEFTYTFENMCEKLSLEELSIVAMGFFKSQTHIRNSRVGEVLLSRLESSFQIGDPPPPDSITVASLTKMARYCASPTSDIQMLRTLDAIVPHLKSISLLGCLHAVLMGTNIQLFHELVTSTVCGRYASEIGKARLKDLERLAFVLTLYNYDPRTEPCIYNTMVGELRKRLTDAEKEGKKWNEVERHGECLLRFLAYLSLRNIFPLDLIEKAMDPDFITHVYGKSRGKIGREVLILDVNLEIQCPNYKTHRLNSKLRAFLAKKFRHIFFEVTEGMKMTVANRLHFEILETIKTFPGAEGKVTSWQILPQFERADIVFCTDESGVFQESILPKSDIAVMKCPKNYGQWHTIVPGSRNSFIKLSNKPLGPMVCKLKQLESLGYKPTLIPWYEWDAVKSEERHHYLRSKIFYC